MVVVSNEFYATTGYLKFDNYSSGSLIGSIIYAIESYERAFIIIFFLTIHRLIFSIFLPFLFLFSALAAYFIYKFKIQITERTIPVFFEATPNEISAFLSANLVLWCLFSLLLAFGFVWFFLIHDKKDTKIKRNRIFVFVVAAFTLSALFFPGHSQNSQYMPFNYLKSTSNYFLSKYYKIGRQDISNYPSKFPAKDITVVMIIGESARGGHFSLNGYNRDTNPNLSKINNLVSFSSATSCDNLTRMAVPCMLTSATKENKDPSSTETSFISIFRKLGFDTVWIDNQQLKNSFINTNITEIMNEAKTIISPEQTTNNINYDTNILPFLDGILDKQQGKVLIVIHSAGSHWPYDTHYDEQHQQWNPVCKNSQNTRKQSTVPIKCNTDTWLNSCGYVYEMSRCDRQSLINSYDNTILQTDHFISEVINRLAGRNAILLYSSDHGESLGEDGFFLHGQGSETNARPEQFDVPMIFWGSDEFIKNNPDKFLSATHKSKYKVDHDIIFHSLLSCSGIEAEIIDKSLSICNDWPQKK